MHFLLPLEKGGWEGFEKLSLFKLIFQIHLNPPFLKEEENSQFSIFNQFFNFSIFILFLNLNIESLEIYWKLVIGHWKFLLKFQGFEILKD